MTTDMAGAGDAPLITSVVTVLEAELDEAVVSIDWSPAGRLGVLTADGRVMIDVPQRSSQPVGGAVRDLTWVGDGLVAVADHRLGIVLAGGGDPTTHPLERARVVTGRRERLIAIGADRVWSLDRDGRIIAVPGRCGELHAVSFVTASLVAVAGTDGIALVDLGLGVVDTRVELEAPLSVAADPTGETLAAGDLGGSIHVLRVGDETNGRELTGYPERVRLLGWADHGHWLLATSDDELTCWLMVGDPGERWPADEPESCLGHDEAITVLAATPHGDLAVTGDALGRVSVWSLRAPHQPVASFGLAGEITAAAWSADATRLAVGDVTGAVQVCAVLRGQVV